MANKNNSVSDEKIKGASGGKVQQYGRKFNIRDNDSNDVVTSYDNELDAEKGNLLYHQGKKVGKLDGYYKGFSEGMNRVMKDFRHRNK